MWLLYLGLACLFIFLSQLSGLPQAMFYHLHWAVALPMAFMGFLVLIPGLIKEIIYFLIWPFFRPFVQLLIEAVGFVNITSEEDSQADISNQKLYSNSLSPFYSIASPRASPRPRSPLRLSQQLTEQQQLHQQLQQQHLYWTPTNSRPASPTTQSRHDDDDDEDHVINNDREMLKRICYEAVKSAKATPTAAASTVPEKRQVDAAAASSSPSPPEATTSLTALCEDFYARKWEPKKTRSSHSGSCSSSETDEDEAKRKAQELKTKKLEEQYEIAIRTLTPIIRQHVRRLKSASPKKRGGKTVADAGKMVVNAGEMDTDAGSTADASMDAGFAQVTSRGKSEKSELDRRPSEEMT